jgi:Ca-activated chloride channel family protein
MGNYKDSKIQTLAQRGNGNFAYLDSYLEIEKVLLKEFMQTLHTVADDASLTVQFDPAWVKEYRVIGFDNKVSALNDSTATLLGGEIGPGYSMLAAFEIVPAKNIKDGLVDPVQFTLHYKRPGGKAKSEMSDHPRLRYTPFSELAPSDKFAAAVVLFGSLLRNSKYVKGASWNEVLSIARPAVNPNNYSQVEFLRLVEEAKRLYGNKKRKKEG